MNESHSQPLAAIARAAEAHDHEAIAEIEVAQEPKSEGGELITPREASRIRLHVLKSALGQRRRNARRPLMRGLKSPPIAAA